MKNFSPKRFIAAWLFGAIIFCVQSCDDQNLKLEKSKVQFALSPGTISDGRAADIDLPENALVRLNITSRSGTPILYKREIQVFKSGDVFITDPLELLPGSYAITDFMIVKDSEVTNAAPKSESPFSAFVTHSLPYNFSITETGIANVNMQVIDVRKGKPEAFGYTSFKFNELRFMVSKSRGRRISLREATAELRQGKNLIKTFSINPGMNRVAFEGDPDALYTLSVYAGKEAKAKTFNFKELKKELGAKPLKITLEPALLLTIGSGVEEDNEYEEYFEFALDGMGGAVNINWGDGYGNTYTLPLNSMHEYTTGSYTAIITGDLDQITNLHGFSYNTSIYAIRGLTNLTDLKTYNPSWGAVPIRVDLSNCKKLETIHVQKYGAPYEPIDLRTDFKLPTEHFIKEFLFNAPSFDITRENISAGELEVFVDNIYNNATRRHIYEGRFIIYPVEAPTPETQRKLDILQNDYNWYIGLNGDISDDHSGAGRVKQDVNARRENWLRHNFPKRKHISRSAKKSSASFIQVL